MNAVRRDVLRGLATLAAGSLLPTPLARAGVPVLRAQKLAWAGVRLQLEKDSLFLDPLASPDVWGAALKDPWCRSRRMKERATS
mgnify:CR=1 FL=1